MGSIAQKLAASAGGFSDTEHPRDDHGRFAESDKSGVAPTPEHHKRATEFVNGWKKNVFHPTAIAYRSAAAEAFGTPVENDAKRLARQHYEHDRKLVKGPNEGLSSMKKSTAEVDKHIARGRQHKEIAETIAHASQKAHEGDGDHVTLYRGITGPQAREIMDAKAASRPVNIKVDTLASFTDDHSIAKQFAEHGSQGKKKNDGVVIKVQVPRHAIAASHRAYPQLAKEREVVVASHGGFSVDHANIEVHGIGKRNSSMPEQGVPMGA